MPPLDNSKHEAFAQAVAKGLNASEAYEAAGYSPHRQNAARLMTNDDIAARVAELRKDLVERAVGAISFEAAAMFKDLVRDIELARLAGDHKSALEGRKFLIRCFGYEDSPTLTHEHVKGSPLRDQKAGDESTDVERPPVSLQGFSEALRKFRRRNDDS